MLTSGNVAKEQVGSQGVTAMGREAEEHLLKSRRCCILEQRIGQGTILCFRVHMGGVPDRDKDRVPGRERGSLLGNSTLKNGSGLKIGVNQKALGYWSPDSSWVVYIDPTLSSRMYSMDFP